MRRRSNLRKILLVFENHYIKQTTKKFHLFRQTRYKWRSPLKTLHGSKGAALLQLNRRMSYLVLNLFPSETIGDYWRKADGKPFGFDNLRVILAFSVILWHTILVCYGRASKSWFWTGPLRPLAYFIIPSFFALSGFLVAGSLLRNDLLSFASLRFLRIYPALAFEVLLSAFLIGPLLTQYSMHEYFSDTLLFKYMLNVFGWIHYDLPGLFLDNPGGRAVNLQLWTVPFELECYLLLVLLALVGLHRKPLRFFWIAVAFTAAMMLRSGITGNLPAIDGRPPGKMIVFSFIFGVALFLLKDQIRINFWTFLAALAIYTTLIYNEYGILCVASLRRLCDRLYRDTESAPAFGRCPCRLFLRNLPVRVSTPTGHLLSAS